MTCERIPMPGGLTAIVCRGRGRRPKKCAWCSEASLFQCDWKMSAGGTCDLHLCADHALEVGPEKHLCPTHQRAFEAWQAKRAERQPELLLEAPK